METNAETGMEIQWMQPEDLPAGVLKDFCRVFASQPVSELIGNVETEFRMLGISEDICFPVSINNAEWDNSYVCSPYTAYVPYANDEVSRKITRKPVRWLLHALIKSVSEWLKSAEINKNVHVNNFLLSTNPYPEWSGAQIQAVTGFLTRQYPGHALIFRSLNVRQHAHLLDKFSENNYLLLGSRQVYLYDEPFAGWIKRNNNKQDRRIVRNKKLRYLDHDAMRGHLEQAWHLYNLLYLEKYSRHNPQFTLAYFRQMHHSKTMYFQGYADARNQLKAFAGLFTPGNTITSPLVGYDTAAPPKECLYIHAIQLIFDHKYRTGKPLNLSSGAAGFKRLRGGVPSVEYSAVYVAHLKPHRQRVFKVLAFLTNRIGVPLLEKHKL